MPRDDKSRLIMRAVEKLFTSRRLHQITLDDVAKSAKVAKGTIYLYFKDKDDLFLQTALSAFDDLREALEQAVPADAPFEEQLAAACREIAAFFERRRQVYRMIQAEDARMLWCKGNIREGWKAKRRELAEAVAAILRRGVGEGRLRDDTPTPMLAHVLLGLLRMRAWYLAEHPEAEKHAELLVDLFLHGAGRVEAGGS
jgi:TetR/AcrR family fatty acid metabolism transcriptional regulator